MIYEIKNCGVLDVNVDVIVNAANNRLRAGGGVCGAIFAKANDDRLEKECRAYDYVDTGFSAITKGYNTGAKYIIHTVGPNIYDNRINWQELLCNAYKSSLKLADNRETETIALPCVSTGIFSCPLLEATIIAIGVVSNFKPKHLKKCYLCCYTKEEYDTYLRVNKYFDDGE